MPTEQIQPKRKTRAHPFSERKRVVELYESGLGSKRIAQALDLDDSMVRRWLRLYRASGLEALRPCYNVGVEPGAGDRMTHWEKTELEFQPAYELYTTTLESVTMITRRCGLNYQRFIHHLRRYHPELIEQRNRLIRSVAGSVPAQGKA